MYIVVRLDRSACANNKPEVSVKTAKNKYFLIAFFLDPKIIPVSKPKSPLDTLALKVFDDFGVKMVWVEGLADVVVHSDFLQVLLDFNQ